MLGQTVTNMLTSLRAELGSVLSVPSYTDTMLIAKMQNIQTALGDKFWWDHLDTRANVTMTAGDRYGTLPVTINFDGIVNVQTKYNDNYIPLEYGIDDDELNYKDSDDDERDNPIRRWRRYGATQFEVWPIPSDEETIRFRGTAPLSALTTGSSTCDLDDLLVVLTTAAQIARKNESADADELYRRALERYYQLRINKPNVAPVWNLNGYCPGRRHTDEQWKTVAAGPILSNITADSTAIYV